MNIERRILQMSRDPRMYQPELQPLSVGIDTWIAVMQARDLD